MSEARWESHESLIKDLLSIPEKYAQPPQSTLAKLPKPTKKDNEKGTCSVCGGWHGLPAVHLDYMGHGEVTLALIDADPLWTWGAIEDERGVPIVEDEQNRYVMWGWLEVCGVRRPCVGTCDLNKPEPEKELIGDLLRNGAMRFGIGTKLWSKATDADAAGSGGAGRVSRRKAAPQPEREAFVKTAGMLLFDRLTGQTPEVQAKLREIKGNYANAKLTAASFDENPEWLDAVVAVLDGAS